MAAEVKYTITAEDKTAGATSSATNGITKMIRSFVDLKAVLDFSRQAWDFLKGGIIDCVGEFTNSLDQSTKLGQVLKSTGNVINSTTDELEGFSQGLQDLTGISGDAINEADALMLSFTNIGRDVFPHATMSALNMKQMFGSLQSAALQVGKALNDPIQGVGALRRVGVQLTDEQENMINKFMEVNNIAGAQKIILAELEREFGGVAVAMGDTFSGSLNKLKENIGDIKEMLGEQIATLTKPAIDAINKFLTENRDKIANLVENLPEVFKIVMNTIEKIIKKTFEPATFSEVFKQLGNVMLASFRAAIEMIPVLLTNLFKSGGALLTIIAGNLALAISEGFHKWLSSQKIMGIPIGVEPLEKDKDYMKLKKDVEKAASDLGQSLGEVSTKFGETFKKYAGEIGAAASGVANIFKKEIDDAKADIKKIMDKDRGGSSATNTLLTSATEAVTTETIETGKRIRSALEQVWDNIKTSGQAIELFGKKYGYGTPQKPEEQPAQQIKMSAFDNINQLATDPLTAMASAINNAIQSVESFAILLDPINSILKYMIDFAKGAINSALQPLVGILVILGQTLGAILVPVFNLLSPVIKLVAEAFVFLYNWAIVPLANTIIVIINIIGMIVAGVANVVIDIINFLGGSVAKVAVPGIGDNLLQQINMTQLNAAGQSAVEAGAGGGGGGQITGGSVYNITVNIYDPLIMGESNQTLDGLAAYIIKRMRLGTEVTA